MLRSDRCPPERSAARQSGCRRLPEAAGGGPPEAGRVQCCEQKSPAGVHPRRGSPATSRHKRALS